MRPQVRVKLLGGVSLSVLLLLQMGVATCPADSFVGRGRKKLIELGWDQPSTS